MVKSRIERLMESIPQAIKSEARLTIIVDSLNSGEFSSLNPIHQFPRALTLVRYLLNFVIKVGSLDIFDSRLEISSSYRDFLMPCSFQGTICICQTTIVWSAWKFSISLRSLSKLG